MSLSLTGCYLIPPISYVGVRVQTTVLSLCIFVFVLYFCICQATLSRPCPVLVWEQANCQPGRILGCHAALSGHNQVPIKYSNGTINVTDVITTIIIKARRWNTKTPKTKYTIYISGCHKTLQQMKLLVKEILQMLWNCLAKIPFKQNTREQISNHRMHFGLFPGNGPQTEQRNAKCKFSWKRSEGLPHENMKMRHIGKYYSHELWTVTLYFNFLLGTPKWV